MPYKDPTSDIAVQGQKKRSIKSYQKLKDDEDFRKRRRFYQWRHFGIKGDYEEIWRLYENTTSCHDCNKELKGVRGKDCKVTDHHHSSGYFRHIVCCSCNNYRSKIDKQHLSVLLELHRHFLRK
jgi:hypothetical protein